MTVTKLSPQGHVKLGCMGHGTKILVVGPAWQAAIDDWDAELAAGAPSKGTRNLRNYQMRRFAHDHRRILSSPWKTERSHIIKWIAAQNWPSKETTRSFRASLRSFFGWSHKIGLIAENPAAELPKIKPPRRLPRPAPNDVVDNGLRHENLRARMLIAVLAETGVRRAECAAIHTHDLEQDPDGAWWLRVIGKGGRERLVPLSSSLAAALRLLPTGWVFPSTRGGHISPKWLGKIVSAALPGRWTAHNLRHRYATLAYDLEKDIRAVQELLGHASITTTQIYCFVPRESLRRAASGARTGLTAIAGAGCLPRKPRALQEPTREGDDIVDRISSDAEAAEVAQHLKHAIQEQVDMLVRLEAAYCLDPAKGLLQSTRPERKSS